MYKRYSYIKFYRLLVKILWKLRKIRYRILLPTRFIYILAIIAGFVSGIYALMIVKITVWVNEALMHGLFREYNYYYFLFPSIGLLCTYLLIRFVIKKPILQGMPSTLKAITNHGIFKDRYQIFSSLIAVPLTVGLGCSAGLEGPTVVSGASFSAEISNRLKLDQKTRVLIIGCAAVGAMSSLFKAPMAAIVFAIEVFALDFTLGSMVPLLLASISAITTSYFFNDDDVIFPLRIIDAFNISDIPYYILLGIFCGIASLIFNFFYHLIGNFFRKHKSPFLKILLGGLFIGIITYFFPPTFGEGVEHVNQMLRGESDILMLKTHFEKYYNQYTIILFILTMGALKMMATSITLGAGGIGGIFGPSLFIGCSLGNSFSKALNVLGFNVSEINFSLIGMSGLLAALLHAPLTAVFLIAEISNGYTLIVPIMLVAVISFVINRYYFKMPFFKEDLAREGELTTHDKDSNILRDIRIYEITDTNIKHVYANQYLRDLVNLIEVSDYDVFPVLDKENKLIGVINVNEYRKLLFESEQYDKVQIKDIMSAPPAIIYKEKDDAKLILQKFDETETWVLPVVEKEDVFYGFAFKTKFLNIYRKKLKNYDYN